MKTYTVDVDGFEIEIAADCAADAARAYVDDGEWGADEATVFIPVRTTDPDGETEWFSFAIHPCEPKCTDGRRGHDWHREGGIAENPGVWGHGGGTVTTETCRHCGITRQTDTWASTPDGGHDTRIQYQREVE